MVRKILILLLLTFPILKGRSQVLVSLLLGDELNSGKIEFGLDGGINFYSQTGTKGNSSSDFNLGFYFDIKLKDPSWMIHTGVIVKSNLGAGGLPIYSLNNPDLDNLFAGGSVNRKMNYFNVPILLKRRFKNNFYVEAGPQLGLMYNAVDEFTANVGGQDLLYKNEISDQFHRIDAGLMTGIGYRLMKGMGMNLGIRYYWGLMDALKNNSGTAVMNRSLYLVVGIPVGAGKAKERAEKKKKSE